MLLVKTRLGESSIHGIGVLANEFIPKGTLVWKWHEGVDQNISTQLVDALPDIAKEYIKRYSWFSGGWYCLCSDNDRFLNHSDNPNCGLLGDWGDVALKDIQIGEELTVDYRKFDPHFGSKEHGYDWV
jgi:SET domain-containing protein